MQINTTPNSPCNKDCIMDQETHYCKGCYRTIEEIIRWQFLTTEEKNNILVLTEQRKKSININHHPS